MKNNTKIWFRVRLRGFLVRGLNIGRFGLKTAHFFYAHIDHQTQSYRLYCEEVALLAYSVSEMGNRNGFSELKQKDLFLAGQWKSWLTLGDFSSVNVMGKTVTEQGGFDD